MVFNKQNETIRSINNIKKEYNNEFTYEIE